MRICVPVTDNNGLKSSVFTHFGSAPYFFIYNIGQETFEIISNRNRQHIHGKCNPLKMLTGYNINIVVCLGIGARAVQELGKGGIKVYKVAANTAKQAVDKYRQHIFQEVKAENACTSHSCK
jgi:predicted Fe-Mo cluster-binding NifX family protein